MQREEKDPGIGLVYKRKTKRVINKDGSFNVLRKGRVLPFRDIYLYLVNMSWRRLFFTIFSFYMAINAIFALTYLIIGIENLSNYPDSHIIDEFFHAFFFSVQTFTTVGYGATSPIGWMTNMIASVEAMLGLISFAFATGLLYGRFSRPNAKFMFSDNMLISPYNKTNALMFRVANERSNVLMEVEISVLIAFRDHSMKDNYSKKYYKLKLERDSLHFLPLAWTIVHPIDSDSPFYGKTTKELKSIPFEILVHMKAFDDTFSNNVHRRFSYVSENDLVVGAKFEKPFHANEHGDIILDLDLMSSFKKVNLNSTLTKMTS